MPHEYIEKSWYPQISDLFDMMNHFIGFTIFNFLLFSTFLGKYDKSVYKKALVLYVMIGVSWGLLCEGIQLLNATRSFQIIDLFANTAPVLIIFILFRKKRMDKL